MPNELKHEDVMDILDRMDFFQGQRAGRELWHEKPFEVQEQDIADFAKGITAIKAFINVSLAIIRENRSQISVLKKLLERCETQFAEKDAEIERFKNRITFQVVIPDEKMEEIKKECLERVELDIKAIKAEAISDVVAQLEAEVDSSDKYIAEYDGSKVQIAYNQGLKNALKIVKEMEDVENGKSDL